MLIFFAFCAFGKKSNIPISTQYVNVHLPCFFSAMTRTMIL